VELNSTAGKDTQLNRTTRDDVRTQVRSGAPSEIGSFGRTSAPIAQHTKKVNGPAAYGIRLTFTTLAWAAGAFEALFNVRSPLLADLPHTGVAFQSWASLRYRSDLPDILEPQQHRVLLRLRDRSRI